MKIVKKAATTIQIDTSLWTTWTRLSVLLGPTGDWTTSPGPLSRCLCNKDMLIGRYSAMVKPWWRDLFQYEGHISVHRDCRYKETTVVRHGVRSSCCESYRNYSSGIYIYHPLSVSIKLKIYYKKKSNQAYSAYHCNLTGLYYGW